MNVNGMIETKAKLPRTQLRVIYKLTVLGGVYPLTVILGTEGLKQGGSSSDLSLGRAGIVTVNSELSARNFLVGIGRW